MLLWKGEKENTAMFLRNKVLLIPDPQRTEGLPLIPLTLDPEATHAHKGRPLECWLENQRPHCGPLQSPSSPPHWSQSQY